VATPDRTDGSRKREKDKYRVEENAEKKGGRQIFKSLASQEAVF
jgi:hypothetical protein